MSSAHSMPASASTIPASASSPTIRFIPRMSRWTVSVPNCWPPIAWRDPAMLDAASLGRSRADRRDHVGHGVRADDAGDGRRIERRVRVIEDHGVAGHRHSLHERSYGRVARLRRPMMHRGREADVMVVGAGPAGLAVSRELRTRGVDHLVLERGAIGQSWRRYYDGLVLHTGRHLSSLPGRPFARSDPMFVTRDRFVRYLDEYAAAMDLPVEAGADVTAVRREDGHWALDGRGARRAVALSDPRRRHGYRLIAGDATAARSRDVPRADPPFDRLPATGAVRRSPRPRRRRRQFGRGDRGRAGERRGARLDRHPLRGRRRPARDRRHPEPVPRDAHPTPAALPGGADRRGRQPPADAPPATVAAALGREPARRDPAHRDAPARRDLGRDGRGPAGGRRVRGRDGPLRRWIGGGRSTRSSSPPGSARRSTRSRVS